MDSQIINCVKLKKKHFLFLFIAKGKKPSAGGKKDIVMKKLKKENTRLKKNEYEKIKKERKENVFEGRTVEQKTK